MLESSRSVVKDFLLPNPLNLPVSCHPLPSPCTDCGFSSLLARVQAGIEHRVFRIAQVATRDHDLSPPGCLTLPVVFHRITHRPVQRTIRHGAFPTFQLEESQSSTRQDLLLSGADPDRLERRICTLRSDRGPSSCRTDSHGID